MLNNLREKISSNKFDKVIADVGAGDGKQIYRLARKNPQNFYIAIEPNFESYKETEQKTNLRKEKGGLDNLLFINSSIENIPTELENIFDEIQINFPWGSLLEGVMIPLEEVLQKLVMIAKNGAELMIITTYDDKFEKEFRATRKLPPLNLEYINSSLSESFKKFGINIADSKLATQNSLLNLDSPWGKKLLSSRKRDVYKIIAQISKTDN